MQPKSIEIIMPPNPWVSENDFAKSKNFDKIFNNLFPCFKMKDLFIWKLGEQEFFVLNFYNWQHWSVNALKVSQYFMKKNSPVKTLLSEL